MTHFEHGCPSHPSDVVELMSWTARLPLQGSPTALGAARRASGAPTGVRVRISIAMDRATRAILGANLGPARLPRPRVSPLRVAALVRSRRTRTTGAAGSWDVATRPSTVVRGRGLLD